MVIIQGMLRISRNLYVLVYRHLKSLYLAKVRLWFRVAKMR